MIRRRAATLMEILVVTLILSVVGMMAYRQFVSIFVVTNASNDTDASVANARGAVDTMVDHVRNAALCTDATQGTLNSALHSATATSFAYYVNSTCTWVSYALSGDRLVRTDNGVSKTVAKNVSGLALTYYKATSYNSPWTATANASAPTTAELPYVCGIRVDVTTVRNGVSSRIVTTVRLRNAPKKNSLDGSS